MRNMRIGTRVLAGFGILVLLTAGMGLFALYKQALVRSFAAQMNERDFRILDTLRGISRSEAEMRAARGQVLLDHLLQKQVVQPGDPESAQREWEQRREQNLKLLTDLQASAGNFEKSGLTAERQMQWRRVRLAAAEAEAALRKLAPEVEAQFAMLGRGEAAQAAARMPLINNLRLAFEDRLETAQRLTEEQIGIGRAAIETYYDETRNSVLVALAIAVFAAIVLSVVIQRSVTEPLGTFMHVMDRIGKGDLTEKAPVDRRDELGDLAHSLNQMVAGLREVAGQTRTVAENLSAATAEILASTQQQAAATAEQSAAVQQTNATMAEISQSGAQIAERAKSVATAAEATSTASAVGLESVQNTNTTMESIREQAEAVAENVVALSDKTQAVGEIIASVNDIAEQSHLLALNAAIEAAAAGEHGRSFSVVAGEMKNLADQSKQATVQVRSILGDIQKSITSSVMLTEEAVKRVESGRQQAEVADRTIRQLTGNIQQSVQAFQQIVAGSGQQQVGFEQVTQAVKSIGVASEQTAVSTKQSEKAASNLNALAQQLRAAVERYHL